MQMRHNGNLSTKVRGLQAGAKKVTTPVDDGPPGGELQVDFGYLGLVPAGEGRRRKLRALVFTACFSRFMFAYLTFSMTLEEVIAGCEDAWAFFGGVFAVVVPENVARHIFRLVCPAALCARRRRVGGCCGKSQLTGVMAGT